MIYQPSKGRLKDLWVLWHEGAFYLFSMYSTDPAGGKENYRNMWMAKSEDGVHWHDIGPVILNAPFKIWAMAVHKAGDKFIMNHGSYGKLGDFHSPHPCLRFWESTDLINWSYMGEDYDLWPDESIYPHGSPLDCMDVVPVVDEDGPKYYGYATGPAGFLVSEDAVNWKFLPPNDPFEWEGCPAPPSRNEAVLR